MSIVVPKYTELYNSTLADLKISLGITTGLIGKTVLPVFAAVQSVKLLVMYRALSKIDSNVYPDLADEDTLRRFGRVRLGRDVNPAIAGEYNVTVTGDISAVIDVNQTFSNEDGFLYVLDTQFTFVATSGTISLRALTAGIEAQLDVSDQLQITSSAASVDSIGVVLLVTLLPTAAETIEDYRDNVVDSFRLLPQGGARSDYRRWTENIAGLREVYPYVISGQANQINLFIEAFEADSIDGFGTPPAAMLALVEATIEPEFIPITVTNINYVVIDPTPVIITVVGISDTGFNTTIEASIKSYLNDIRPFIGGVDLVSEQNKGFLYASTIQGLIIATGVTFTSVTVTVDAVPVSIYEFVDDKIPYLSSYSAP